MAIWEFNSSFDFETLDKIKEHYDGLYALGMEYDDEMYQALCKEIEEREKKGYKYMVLFVANSNENGDRINKTMLLHYLPKDRKEVQDTVKKSYDGVWVPDMETIELFHLSAVV